MQGLTFCLLLLFLFLAATFYGKDGWTIHYGSCGYGYLDENAGTGGLTSRP